MVATRNSSCHTSRMGPEPSTYPRSVEIVVRFAAGSSVTVAVSRKCSMLSADSAEVPAREALERHDRIKTASAAEVLIDSPIGYSSLASSIRKLPQGEFNQAVM